MTLRAKDYKPLLKAAVELELELRRIEKYAGKIHLAVDPRSPDGEHRIIKPGILGVDTKYLVGIRNALIQIAKKREEESG